MADGIDDSLKRAVHRYEVISAYVAENPPRGKRHALLERLAAREWVTPEGALVRYSVETLRVWVRLYRCRGIDGLRDAVRAGPGPRVLCGDVIAEACKLKQEVPERTLDKIIKILEALGKVEPGQVRRSTLHRALKARNLSARRLKTPDEGDLDRWQADYANDLWQADMLHGPWLPDPERPGKVRRAYLYAFIDDASRYLLHGRWSFKGDLPALELVFRRSLQRHGVPRRVYYDNGWTFRSRHMREICAFVGIHAPTHTKKYRPQGHGKIEAFNRFCRGAFIAEVKASPITTLDALNLAFVAWVEEEYNLRRHAELCCSPLERWRRDNERLRFVDEEKLRLAFLWTEARTPDKCGVFALLGHRYQGSPSIARKRIDVRYDPEHLDEVEVWHRRQFLERVRPLQITTHRRPRTESEPSAAPATKPGTDWLGHLVAKRRARIDGEPVPSSATHPARLAEALPEFLELVRQNVHPDVFDESAATEFHRRYGPFDPKHVAEALASTVQDGRRDHHLTIYLEAIRRNHHGGDRS